MRKGRWSVRSALVVAVTSASLLPGACGPSGTAADGVEEDRIVVLVRHAEKEPGEDPALSEAGRARARTLAHVLSAWSVDAIYVSGFRRTRETAAPLAELSDVTPAVVDAARVEELVDRVRSHEGTVVVVGHSNTVPVLIKALGGPSVEQIPDHVYDDFFVLHLSGPGEDARLLHLKYGHPSPGSAERPQALPTAR